MTKGFYDINTPSPRISTNPSNSAWKSFTCSLLILATICFIILLISWKFHQSPMYEIPPDSTFIAAEKSYQDDKSKPNKSIESTPLNNDEVESIGTQNNNNETKGNIQLFPKNIIPESESSTTEKDIYQDQTEITSESSEAHETNLLNGWQNAPYDPSNLTYLSSALDINIKKPVCASKICHKAVSKMMGLLSYDDKPCEDYYSFLCNGFLKNSVEIDLTINVQRRIYEEIEKLAEDTDNNWYVIYKDYLTSCINYDPILNEFSEVKANLENLTRLYLQNQEFPSLEYLLSRFLKVGFTPIFDVNVELNKKHKSFGVTLSPGLYESTLQSIIGGNYFNKMCMNILDKVGSSSDNYDNYLKCVVDTSSIVNMVEKVMKPIKAFTNYNISNELPKIIRLINEKKPSIADIKRSLKTESYTKKTVKYLKQTMDQLIWDNIFNYTIGYTLDDSVEVKIYHLDYLEDVVGVLTNMDKKSLYKALTALYIHSLYQDFILTQNTHERRDYCLKTATKFMPDITSNIYLSSYNTMDIHELSAFIQKMYKLLKEEIITQIKDGKWLSDNNNRTEALEIIQKLELIIVTAPIEIDNDTYFNVNIKSDDFMGNVIELENHYRTQLYSSFGKSGHYNGPYFPVYPFETTESNIPALNYVVLPFAAISRYLNPEEFPIYLLLGDIGFRLAKQLNYHLLINKIDIIQEPGKLSKTEDAINIKQNSWEEIIQMKLSYSEIERISDNGGIKLVQLLLNNNKVMNISKDFPLVALNKTVEELFFMQLGQSFCTKSSIHDTKLQFWDRNELPDFIRINSIMANDETFHKVFDCPSDSTMFSALLIKGNNILFEEQETTDATLTSV